MTKKPRFMMQPASYQAALDFARKRGGQDAADDMERFRKRMGVTIDAQQAGVLVCLPMILSEPDWGACIAARCSGCDCIVARHPATDMTRVTRIICADCMMRELAAQ